MIPLPLHERITPEQLERICNLIRSRTSTVEDAFALEFGLTRQQVWKCRKRGQQAAEKEERGEELTEGEQKALWFDRELRKAQAMRTHQLTRDALGIIKDGTRDPRKESRNAMQILVLTSEAYRTPYKEEEEWADAAPPLTPPTPPLPVEALTEQELAQLAAVRGLRLVPLDDPYLPDSASPANAQPR
jgi:hypothetical protein